MRSCKQNSEELKITRLESVQTGINRISISESWEWLDGNSPSMVNSDGRRQQSNQDPKLKINEYQRTRQKKQREQIRERETELNNQIYNLEQEKIEYKKQSRILSDQIQHMQIQYKDLQRETQIGKSKQRIQSEYPIRCAQAWGIFMDNPFRIISNEHIFALKTVEYGSMYIKWFSMIKLQLAKFRRTLDPEDRQTLRWRIIDHYQFERRVLNINPELRQNFERVHVEDLKEDYKYIKRQGLLYKNAAQNLLLPGQRQQIFGIMNQHLKDVQKIAKFGREIVQCTQSQDEGLARDICIGNYNFEQSMYELKGLKQSFHILQSQETSMNNYRQYSYSTGEILHDSLFNILLPEQLAEIIEDVYPFAINYYFFGMVVYAMEAQSRLEATGQDLVKDIDQNNLYQTNDAFQDFLTHLLDS